MIVIYNEWMEIYYWAYFYTSYTNIELSSALIIYDPTLLYNMFIWKTIKIK